MKSSSLAIFVTVVLSGCGPAAPNPMVEAVATPTPFPPPAPRASAPAPAPAPIVVVVLNNVTPETVPNTDTASGVHIEDAIQKACGIADEDAYFAFDSSHVDADDRRVLRQVATCFERGPLAGKRMRLVGHADPRGDDDRNMVLGMRRARSVERYLVDEGVERRNVDTSSRGAMDAQGTDPGGWAKDRRVDLLSAK
jgi:peptidoglycan-associated lipoprotein